MSTLHRPKLIAFDLDFTLWPFWVDTHVDPPFRKNTIGAVYDSRGHKIEHYPEVPETLQNLANEGYDLAVVSRTGEVNGANQLLRLFDWDKFFKYKEIYVGTKTKHFQKIHYKTGIDYRDMLFFDDEIRNIRDVSQMGVTCILVNNGTTKDIVEHGLREFSKKMYSQ